MENKKFVKDSRVSLDYDLGTVISVSNDGEKAKIRWDSDGEKTTYDADTFFKKGEGRVIENPDPRLNKIRILIDESCEMAEVHLNDKCIMVGNFWDFHPGCHGIHEYGDFKGFDSLAVSVAHKLNEQGKKSIIVREKYDYLKSLEK